MTSVNTTPTKPKRKINPGVLLVACTDGWRQIGELRSFDTDKHEVSPGLLADVISTFENRERQVVVQVGWAPPADPSGTFIGKVFKDGNAEDPVETLETRSIGEVFRWVEEKMALSSDVAETFRKVAEGSVKDPNRRRFSQTPDPSFRNKVRGLRGIKQMVAA